MQSRRNDCVQRKETGATEVVQSLDLPEHPYGKRVGHELRHLVRLCQELLTLLQITAEEHSIDEKTSSPNDNSML